MEQKAQYFPDVVENKRKAARGSVKKKNNKKLQLEPLILSKIPYGLHMTTFCLDLPPNGLVFIRTECARSLQGTGSVSVHMQTYTSCITL